LHLRNRIPYILIVMENIATQVEPQTNKNGYIIINNVGKR